MDDQIVILLVGMLQTDCLSFGIGECRAPGPLCGEAARDRCRLTLFTMSATQPAAAVRHSKFYIDDRKSFVTLLVRHINLSH